MDGKSSRSQLNDIGGSADLSVIVLTKNEEVNLARCLKSLPPCKEIIVFDSFSTDSTSQIAQSYPATFIQRKFDDYSSQRNAATQHAKTKWILFIDADEEVSEQLRSAIANIAKAESAKASAYALPRKVEFCGKTLRFGKAKDYPIRLFQRGKFKYVGTVHEVPEVDGPVKRLSKGFLAHRSYRDLSHYFEKFNQYTSLIAAQHFAKGRRANHVVAFLRSKSEFLYRYFVRLGFLDGYAGAMYAAVSSFYVLIKYAKLIERQEQSLTRK